jgi:hypothetical protein
MEDQYNLSKRKREESVRITLPHGKVTYKSVINRGIWYL